MENINIPNKYIKELLLHNDKYLSKIFNKEEYSNFIKATENISAKDNFKESVSAFVLLYAAHIKKQFQKTDHNYSEKLYGFISNNDSKVKIYWGDCYKFLKQLPSESINLMITSPPYYNARDYSQWPDLNNYLEEMKTIITESYRVLDNNRVFVFNVGDIFDNDNLTVKSIWGKRRLPLGAYFIKIFEDCGFTFVDDFIWDKGEVQSERHKNGQTPYPFYEYPMNSYEHILIFHKHRLDHTKYPCPVCGSLNVSKNSQPEIGLQSWECKNSGCTARSKGNRGKRYSLKSIMTQNEYLRKENTISEELIKKWRKDIIKFSPVIKINSKGENKLGHTAPFPEDIPEMAIKFYSYKGDIVLDPFAGSFTTAISAVKLGRIGIGCELRKDLFEKAIKNNILRKSLLFEEYND